VSHVSDRLTAWVTTHFEAVTAERVLTVLRELPPEIIGGQDLERVQAAMVLRTAGDWGLVQGNLALARRDWRDALVGGGLAHVDWPRVLDEELGS
jgi:hypothetical protein